MSFDLKVLVQNGFVMQNNESAKDLRWVRERKAIIRASFHVTDLGYILPSAAEHPKPGFEAWKPWTCVGTCCLSASAARNRPS